jgi:NAD(P)-dependent dehydrogenase (short-subunit alcohol dehydrogenase family)
MASEQVCDTVLVTGAGAGIGRAVLEDLLERGVRVAAVDVDAAARAPLADRGVPVYTADLLDPAAAEQAVHAAWDALGTLEGVVNCAGIYPVTPLLELPLAEWDRVIHLNLRAPFVVGRAAARRMVDAGIAGSIVNISSTAARFSRPGVAHYGASKAGLEQLTRNMAVELAGHGIRVNAVAPGVVGTQTVLDKSRASGQAEHAAKLARIPLGRIAETADIVPLVRMLLSRATAYCTGSVFLADGGLTLGMSGY